MFFLLFWLRAVFVASRLRSFTSWVFDREYVDGFLPLVYVNDLNPIVDSNSRSDLDDDDMR